MRFRHYSAVLAVSVLAAALGCGAFAQQLEQAPAQQPEQPPVQQPEQTIGQEELPLGPQPRLRHTVMHVDAAGAHVQVGQRFTFIGPLGPNGNYIVVPHNVSQNARTRWLPIPYFAQRVPNTRSVWRLTDVRVLDSYEHRDGSVHAITMNVLEENENGIVRLEFATERHTGSLGVHGGHAHLTIR
jgi:hypothetical protein